MSSTRPSWRNTAASLPAWLRSKPAAAARNGTPSSTIRSPTSASAAGICAAFGMSPRASCWAVRCLRNRLFINTALQYNFQRESVLTLPFPHNESKKEWVNSFTQLDLVLSPKQIVTATFHFSPQHINFVNPDYFNPQAVTPSYAQHNYVGTVADHWGLFGGILDSSLSIQRFNVVIGSQGDADMVLSSAEQQRQLLRRAESRCQPHRMAGNLVARSAPRRRNPPLEDGDFLNRLQR